LWKIFEQYKLMKKYLKETVEKNFPSGIDFAFAYGNKKKLKKGHLYFNKKERIQVNFINNQKKIK
jgi:hypothetical protein